MWQCPICNEKVPNSLHRCWNCGTWLEGESSETETLPLSQKSVVRPAPVSPFIEHGFWSYVDGPLLYFVKALSVEGRQQLIANASVKKTLWPILGIQTVWLVAFAWSVFSNPYIRDFSDWFFGKLGFVLYFATAIVVFLINALAQYTCFRLLGGKARVIVHAYLTMPPILWAFVSYVISLFVAGFFRSNTIFFCLIVLCSLGLIYLNLLTLSQAHDLRMKQTIAAFVGSLFVAIPAIVIIFLVVNLLILASLFVNIIMIIAISALAIVMIYLMQRQELESV